MTPHTTAPAIISANSPDKIFNPQRTAWVLAHEEGAEGIFAARSDELSITRLQTLHPKIRDRAIASWRKAEAALSGRAIPRVTYAWRSFAEQQAIYNQGRTTRGPVVSNARGIPGQSYHCYRLAFDFCLLYDSTGKGKYDKAIWDMKGDFDKDKVADWMEVVKIFQQDGWEWGGSWKTFKDNPHLQMVFAKTWQELWRLHSSGRVDREGNVLFG